eukprot:gene981-4225_t
MECCQDALQHLSWYGLSHARKLPKIARYLARRIRRAALREQHWKVSVGIHIFDELIRTCHSEIRLFLMQYLDVLLDLLQPSSLYHRLAVDSFARFSSIDADTPIYDRMCGDFITVFSSLCWNDTSASKEVRETGIRGLSAVIEKDHDSRRGSIIYDDRSLAQIIPALIYSITKHPNGHTSLNASSRNEDSHEEDNNRHDDVNISDQENVNDIASQVLQSICEHATVATTKPLLRPLFSCFATFGLWEKGDDSISSGIISLVLSSLQGHLIHIVCDELVQHLDTQESLSAMAKRNVIKAISTVCTTTSSIPFMYILNIYNTILAHLRKEIPNVSKQASHLLEDSIVAACADVASSLPNRQKISIIISILSKLSTSHKSEHKYQLLECARGAANTLEVTSLPATLPDALLHPLLGAIVDVSEAPNIKLFPNFIAIIEIQASAAALFYTLIQCPLDVAPTHSLEGPQQRTPSKRDQVFVEERAELLSWYLFEGISHATAASSNVLTHLSNISFHFGAYFGIKALASMLKMILALQRPPCPSLSLHFAFVAVFLKRIAFVRGLDLLASYVDEIAENSPDVLDAARAFGPRDCFTVSSSVAMGDPIYFEPEEIVHMLNRCGITSEVIDAITAQPYIHAGSVQEIEKTRAPRPQLRPMIRVFSIDESSINMGSYNSVSEPYGVRSEDVGYDSGNKLPDDSAKVLPFSRNRFSFDELIQGCNAQEKPQAPTEATIFSKTSASLTIADIALRALDLRPSVRPLSMLSHQWHPVAASPLGF